MGLSISVDLAHTAKHGQGGRTSVGNKRGGASAGNSTSVKRSEFLTSRNESATLTSQRYEHYDEDDVVQAEARIMLD